MVANRGYGLDATSLQTTYDLPATPENLGAGSAYKIFTSSTYLAQGGGIYDVPEDEVGENMQLLAEKVMPQVNAAIGKSKVAAE